MHNCRLTIETLIGRQIVGPVLAATVLVLISTQITTAQEIQNGYGRISGREHRESVNGTLVFAEMFRAQDRKVRTWGALSPRLDKFDSVVWIPDEFTPPNEDARVRIEDWLAEEPGRTFIYVGRDYDATQHYWRQVLKQAKQDEASLEEIERIVRRKAVSQQEYDRRRHSVDLDADYVWFSIEGSKSARTSKVRSVEGPWARSIDPTKADLEIRTRFTLPANVSAMEIPFSYYYIEDMYSEVLLESNGDPLIFRIVYDFGTGKSQLIIVANGSFLLNMPLVNHEHRKLANKLILETSAYSDVLFIESGPEPIRVIYVEQHDRQQTAWDWMSVWPWSFVVPHLFIIAIVFCFAYFPIFGRPKSLRDDDASDFGRHISAIGRLFAKTNDGKYMLDKIKYYHEHVRRESGTSHIDELIEEEVAEQERSEN